jgi:dienelactone hydrolase
MLSILREDILPLTELKGRRKLSGYDKEQAKIAWDRTIAFFKKHLN